MQEEKKERRERKLRLLRIAALFSENDTFIEFIFRTGHSEASQEELLLFLPTSFLASGTGSRSAAPDSPPAGSLSRSGIKGKPGIRMPPNHLPVTLHGGPSALLSFLQRSRYAVLACSSRLQRPSWLPSSGKYSLPREVLGIFNRGFIHPVNQPKTEKFFLLPLIISSPTSHLAGHESWAAPQKDLCDVAPFFSSSMHQ